MVEKEPSLELRTAFIDWESYFIGNGFVDLTFLILYGVEIKEFNTCPDLFEKCLDFYLECLFRHGVENNSVLTEAELRKHYLRLYQ